MSTANGSHNASIANIALPSQTTAASTVAGATGAPTVQSSQAYQDYYNSPEYQQYYQQYYANAYTQQQQQQYAAYYQQAGQTVDGTAAAAIYNAALYGQAGQASYLPATYQAVAGTASAYVATSETAAQDDDDEDDDDPTVLKSPGTKAGNTLPYHCNSKMSLNPLLYTNIQQSPYFKTDLFQLKTYHEVIDEIYYNVKHLEPWEKGSRKTNGQTGMCGSVRGVGAGGIISTPFCILFKLYTLKLTRKQVNGLIRHKDSPFIRGIGFLFVRYTQPPSDLWQWFEPFLCDDEEVDPKAGGGKPMMIGEMVRYLLTKLDWFSTLFPRIPIPIQKEIEEKLRKYDEDNPDNPCLSKDWKAEDERADGKSDGYGKQQHRSEAGKYSKYDSRGGGGGGRRSRSRSPSKHSDKRSKYDDDRHKDYDRSNRHKGGNHYY